tara:strand:- start:288 stop:1073 length:786 start_codon:yes stop_codon:yes gene_type:complete
MKKILAVIFFSFLSLTVVNAERISLGVSGNIGMLEASGKETITGTSQRDNIGSQGTFTKQAGTSTTSSTKGSDDIFIGYVALFGELHMFDTGLRLGLSYVPYALESETTANTRVDQCGHSGNGTGGDAGSTRTACSATKQTVQVDVEDLTMLYAAYHHNLDLGFVDSVFIKAGVIDADVITKEKLSSGSKYGNATLEGQFLGLGAEKNLDNGLFIRLEAGMTEYDSIKLTNGSTDTHENANTIDITGLDGATATIAIGKSF